MDLGFFLFVWLVLAAVAAIVARAKNRSGFGWFLLTCLLPLLVLVVVALPRRDPGATKAQPGQGDSPLGRQDGDNPV